MTEDTEFQVSDKRPSGWYRIDNEFLKQYGAILGPYGISVYNALCMYGAHKEQGAWPKQQTIADLIGASRSKVNEALQALEERGLIISVQLPQTDGNRGTKRYSLEPVSLTTTQPCSPQRQLNKTNGTNTNEANASGENPPQSSVVTRQQPNPLTQEYDRLKEQGYGLRDIAVGVVRFAQAQPNNNRLIAGALGMVYRLCFGDRVPPNYPRIMRMSNKAGGPERLATRMLDVAAREVLGDPHDVLEKWRSAWQEREAGNKADEVARTWGL